MGMLVAMFAPTINTLIIGRVLTGIGVGGILVSLNTLVAEYAGKKFCNRCFLIGLYRGLSIRHRELALHIWVWCHDIFFVYSHYSLST